MNPHEEVECEESYGCTADGGVDRTPMTIRSRCPIMENWKEIGDEGEATALNAMEELDGESSDPLSIGEAIQLQLAAKDQKEKAKESWSGHT